MARKHSGNEVYFSVDLTGAIDALAAGQALVVSPKDKNYMNAVIEVAFAEADAEFNTAVDAYAMATGKIGHMYEWGTIGINKGRTNVRPKSDAPGARLWENFTTGSGMNRTLTYTFKPSLAIVPKPTRADTGMSTEVISKMRDHQFKNKAMVMEQGHEVSIAPKKAQFLLIPAYKENRAWMRPHDVKRGYMLYQGTVRNRPGSRKYAGNFTAFWTAFWLDRGNEIVDDAIYRQVTGDFTPAFSAQARAKNMQPAYKTSIQGKVKARMKKIQEQARRKAQARNAGTTR